MRIVIVGDGKVGFELTRRLSAEGHDLVVIDNNPKSVEILSNTLDVIALEGSGVAYQTLEEAEIQSADLAIAVTSSDEVNMLCCLLARKMGAQHTIARVRNPDYAQSLMMLKEDLGLSMTVNPELAAAKEIVRQLRFPSALRVESFAKGRAELVEYRIPEDSALCNISLSRLNSSLNVHVLVCAVRRGSEVFIPSGDFVLRAGDHIHISIPHKETALFFKKLGVHKQQIRDIMIVGGGRVAYYLAREMLQLGVMVRLIERDEARCQELCEMLPGALVIQGDGIDTDLLTEEGLEQSGAFAALTGLDEENVMLSLYARKKMNPDAKIITQVDRLNFLSALSELAVESLISPKTTAANYIVRYVRALQNAHGSSVEALHRFMDGEIESLEFVVRQSAEFLGRPLKDLPLKKNLLIGCIVRKGQVIIPGGRDAIELGDSVLVITNSQQVLRDFNDIFSVHPSVIAEPETLYRETE